MADILHIHALEIADAFQTASTFHAPSSRRHGSGHKNGLVLVSLDPRWKAASVGGGRVTSGAALCPWNAGFSV
eukprot:366087-Chlamydomonas_euryale.AAC.1